MFFMQTPKQQKYRPTYYTDIKLCVTTSQCVYHDFPIKHSVYATASFEYVEGDRVRKKESLKLLLIGLCQQCDVHIFVRNFAHMLNDKNIHFCGNIYMKMTNL